MTPRPIAFVAALTIRIYQTRDGYVALHTVEDIDADGSVPDSALDAAHRAVDAIRTSTRAR